MKQMGKASGWASLARGKQKPDLVTHRDEKVSGSCANYALTKLSLQMRTVVSKALREQWEHKHLAR